MRYSYRAALWWAFFFSQVSMQHIFCLRLKRNPFACVERPCHTVIATACVGDDTDEQATFVQLKGKIRCIKRKTPSTWES